MSKIQNLAVFKTEFGHFQLQAPDKPAFFCANDNGGITGMAGVILNPLKKLGLIYCVMRRMDGQHKADGGGGGRSVHRCAPSGLPGLAT